MTGVSGQNGGYYISRGTGEEGREEGRDGASFVEDLPVVEFMYLACQVRLS